MAKDELIQVQLLKKTFEKVKELVEKNEGLFEDENDYINHGISIYYRDNY